MYLMVIPKHGSMNNRINDANIIANPPIIIIRGIRAHLIMMFRSSSDFERIQSLAIMYKIGARAWEARLQDKIQ